MLLGGIALVLSRLIDNSVVVLENIIRLMEEGERAGIAAEKAARRYHGRARCHRHHLHRVLPRSFFHGVSKLLFTAARIGRSHLHLRVVLLRHDRGAALLRPSSSICTREEGDRENKKPVIFRSHLTAPSTLFPVACSTGTKAGRTRAMKRPGLTASAMLLGGTALILIAFPNPWAVRTSRAPILDSSSSTCECPPARVSKSAMPTSRQGRASDSAGRRAARSRT